MKQREEEKMKRVLSVDTEREQTSSDSSIPQDPQPTPSADQPEKKAAFEPDRGQTAQPPAKRTKDTHLPSSSSSSSSSPPPSSSLLPSSSSLSSAPRPVWSFYHERAESVVVISYRQQGNSLLRYLTAVPHVFAAIAPDFLVGLSACVLFLSLRYHQLFPRYLLKRIEGLKEARYLRRFLLLHVDLDIPDIPLGEVTLLAFHHGFSLLLGCSIQECAGILQLLKVLENKPPDVLLAKLDPRHSQRVIEALTCISPLNKTDVLTLAGEYKTLKKILLASKESLERCPGIGEKKAKKIVRVVREPFFLSSSSSSSSMPRLSSQRTLVFASSSSSSSTLEKTSVFPALLDKA